MEPPEGGLKVAIVEQTAQLGGAQINAIHLHKHLGERYETLCICPGEGPLLEELAGTATRVIVCPMPRLFSTSTRIGTLLVFNPLAVAYDLAALIPVVLRLRRILRREAVDVVLTNGMLAHFYGGLAATAARIACVWHVDDIIKPRLAFGLARALFRAAARALARAVIVPSRAVKDAMLTDAGLAEITTVIHNAVDFSEFAAASPEPALRKEFTVPDGAVVVGVLGRLTEWKGQREFLLAADLVSAQEPGTRFMVVGGPVFEDDSYERSLKALVLDLGLQGVVFTGFRRDIPSCIASMDVCVLPSILPEPFGLVILEAMALGKPVVGTDAGGVSEVIVDGRTGFLVPSRDVGRLAEAVLRLVKDPDLRERMGAAGRFRAAQEFSLEKFIGGHRRVLDGLRR